MAPLEHTLPELENWFKQCVPGGLPPGSLIQPAVATHLKLASEMRPDYEVVANFGTFVGEPELETPPGRTNPPASQPVSAETPKVLSATAAIHPAFPVSPCAER